MNQVELECNVEGMENGRKKAGMIRSFLNARILRYECATALDKGLVRTRFSVEE